MFLPSSSSLVVLPTSKSDVVVRKLLKRGMYVCHCVCFHSSPSPSASISPRKCVRVRVSVRVSVRVRVRVVAYGSSCAPGYGLWVMGYG